MGTKREYAQLSLDDQGQVLIPAELQHALDLQPGDRLAAYMEDGRLVLESHKAILARLRARFAHIPAGVSLADELIAERREAARREALD